MSLIWATRGRSWGFRFLRDGGEDSPLAVYETAFGRVGDDDEVFSSTRAGFAVRFPDPEGRRDRSGRVIPHEFVARGSEFDDLDSFDTARSRIWAIVAEEYRAVWESPAPPAAP